jgi:hypothetical protein
MEFGVSGKSWGEEYVPSDQKSYFRIELLIPEYRLFLRTALPLIQFYPRGVKYQ